MSLTFGRTRVRNFARIFHNNPRQLTRHPYMNFLRHYKHLNPKYGLKRLLQDGARTWHKLRPEEKLMYTQKVCCLPQQVTSTSSKLHNQPSTAFQQVLKDMKQRNSRPNMFRLFPPHPVVFDYKRRSLNAEKNIMRSWRKLEFMPPTPARRPQIIQI